MVKDGGVESGSGEQYNNNKLNDNIKSNKHTAMRGGGNTLKAREAVCFFLCVVGAIFLALDPLHLSIIGNDPNFEAKAVQLPPLSHTRAFPRDTQSKLQRARKWSVNGLMGPESLALDPRGNGFYTGVADGRIMKWHASSSRWEEFAFTSPNRSKEFCDQPLERPLLELIRREEICGRPLGLRFNKETGDLYIADAYYGLMRVGADGGQANCLVNHAEGQRLTFTNDLDIASDGSVYFTDSSAKYQRRNFFLLVVSGDDSGRVVKYHPKTGETSVILKGLQFPNGVALSKDESFLVIAESIPCRLLKYWLKGDKTGETEVLATLPGPPDNVRMNEEGDFWVAMHCRRNLLSHLSASWPQLRHAFLQLPIPFKLVYGIFHGATPHGILAKYNATSGALLDIIEDVSGNVVKYASQVDEHDDRLWIGSVLLPYISIYEIHHNE